MTSMVAAALALLAASTPAPPAAPKLAFTELLESSGGVLRPSARAEALAGHRVRMDGFMAHMEDPPRGGFWLVPRPIVCDESGDGTGDLPPGAVFVLVRSAADRPIAFRPGALSVTGVVELGTRADADGRVSVARIILDRPPRPARARSLRSTRPPEVHR